jgi:hypothetical protein
MGSSGHVLFGSEAFMEDAYAAGLMDGEGTITLYRSHSSDRFRYPVVSVSSTSRELLDFLKDRYGGSICSHRVSRRHHRAHWSWRLVGRQAVSFIDRVLPYMREREKVRRGRHILDNYLRLTPRNGRYSEAAIQAKKQFEAEFFHPESTIEAGSTGAS